MTYSTQALRDLSTMTDNEIKAFYKGFYHANSPGYVATESELNQAVAGVKVLLAYDRAIASVTN